MKKIIFLFLQIILIYSVRQKDDEALSSLIGVLKKLDLENQGDKALKTIKTFVQSSKYNALLTTDQNEKIADQNMHIKQEDIRLAKNSDNTSVVQQQLSKQNENDSSDQTEQISPQQNEQINSKNEQQVQSAKVENQKNSNAITQQNIARPQQSMKLNADQEELNATVIVNKISDYAKEDLYKKNHPEEFPDPDMQFQKKYVDKDDPAIVYNDDPYIQEVMIDKAVVNGQTAYSKESIQNKELWRNLDQKDRHYHDIIYEGQSKPELVGGKLMDTIAANVITTVDHDQTLSGSPSTDTVVSQLTNVANPIKSRLYEAQKNLDVLLNEQQF